LSGYGNCPYNQFPYNGGCLSLANPVVYRVDNDNRAKTFKIEGFSEVSVYKVLNVAQGQVSPLFAGYGSGLYGTGNFGAPQGGVQPVPPILAEVFIYPRAVIVSAKVDVQMQGTFDRQGIQ